MNSRERVLAAVNFEAPDRVPIDLGALRASGINAVVYDRLKKRLGLNSPTKIHDTMQILAEIAGFDRRPAHRRAAVGCR